jgi:hypothetical protein
LMSSNINLYSFTVSSILLLLKLSSPRKFKIAEIPLLLEFLAVHSASLLVVPDTHFLAARNSSCSSNVLLCSGSEGAEYCDLDIPVYQFSVTIIYLRLLPY